MKTLTCKQISEFWAGYPKLGHDTLVRLRSYIGMNMAMDPCLDLIDKYHGPS